MKKLPIALILATAAFLQALAAASVETQISADETSVGGVVQLQVRVEGTTNVSLPGTLDIDGLQVRLTGRSTQVQIVNGSMSTAGIYSYSIRPQREGTFEIPAIEVIVDGQKQMTEPQKLVVQPGLAPRSRPAPALPGPPGTRRPNSATGEAKGRLAFSKVIVPKKTVYAGEVVPVEVLFYFANDENNPRARTNFRALEDTPQVSGEGFTAQKLSPPERGDEVIDGINYNVLTYKTSITAVKSGEMQTPKASFHGVLSVPADGPPDDSIFNQMFGGQGMPGFMDEKEVNIESEPESIHVKALPVEGRPANFPGAVGDFTISASADPLKVAAGDPLTLKIAVSGRGNFDAMGDPTLIETDGWRVYPSTSKFEKSDAIGYGGTKTFEMPMVAQTPQKQTPAAEFSYFDPDKAKYFTLTSKPVAIDAAAAPSTAPTSVAESQPSATPTPEPGNGWLAQSKARAWQPVLKWSGFWMLNGAAALTLIALVAAMAIRRSRRGAAGQRAALKRERDRVISSLGRADLPENSFYAGVFEALTMQANLDGEIGPFELVRALESRGRNVSELQTVLVRADEMKFSGGAGLATRLDAEERRRIVRTLLEVCR